MVMLLWGRNPDSLQLVETGNGAVSNVSNAAADDVASYFVLFLLFLDSGLKQLIEFEVDVLVLFCLVLQKKPRTLRRR